MKKLIPFGLLLLVLNSAFAAPFVIGGREAPAGDLITKSTVSVFLDDENICTGTVINSRTVVTAAHCVASLLEGQLFISSGPNAYEGRKFPVTGIKYSHKDYHKDDYHFWEKRMDVAILVTGEELNLSTVEIGDPDSLNADSKFIQAGYGRLIESVTSPGILKFLTSGKFNTMFSNHLVVIDESPDARISFGDSGGPLYEKADDLKLHGILSQSWRRIEEEENSSFQATYTHPFYFVDWMNCELPEDQKILKSNLNQQYPCDETPLIAPKELPAFNRNVCREQRPGFDLVPVRGCHPVTQEACESEPNYRWDVDQGICR